MRLLIPLSCLILALFMALSQAQTTETSASKKEVFWVSAGYGVPNSFIIGAGKHDIIFPTMGLDIQIAILDRAGVRIDAMPLYYADALINLPPLFSAYAALGPSLIVSSSQVDVGISAKVGMEYRLKVIDFEPMAAFIEVQPRAHLIPSTHFSLSAALGLRVHF